jgi:hypothetical protein
MSGISTCLLQMDVLNKNAHLFLLKEYTGKPLVYLTSTTVPL